MRDYGDDVDETAFGLTGLFSIPALPVVAFAFSGQGGVDWAPILSPIIPLLLGNAFRKFR